MLHAMQRLEEFLAHLQNEERSEATVAKYRRDVLRFFHSLPPGEDRSFTKAAVLRYKDSLPAQYRPASANSMLAALNQFLRFCGAESCCVKQFRRQHAAFRDGGSELTAAEYRRLLAAANRRDPRLALLMQTLCSLGLRVSEHRFVTAESLRRGSLRVTNKGKTRQVPLPGQLKRRLARYCAARGITAGPVFRTRGGKPLDRSNIWAQMKRLSAAAGVAPRKVFPHNLRHLFALTFYRQEKDIVRLADLLGHSSVETTRIYTLTTPEEHARTLERMRLLL